MATLSVTLDEATVVRLDALATQTGHSRERILGDALKSYVEFETAQITKIKEGIAQADRGEFVTEQELDAIEREVGARVAKAS